MPTIMVAEDELLLRMDLAHQLRESGFEVIEAANADEVLALLGSETRIDLLLTDIRMPGTIDGLELAKRLRRRDSSLKIVILSAYIDPYWDWPVDAMFRKPVHLERLVTRLRGLLPPTDEQTDQSLTA